MILSDSFDWQWKFSGTCALHALRHALLCLGVPVSSAQIEDAMGTGYWRRWRGNDEVPVFRALSHFDFEAHIIDTSDGKKYAALLNDELARGRPAILCINNEDHWMVVAGKSEDRYLWIDSDQRSLFGSCTHQKLARLTEYEAESGDRRHWALALRSSATTGCGSMVPRMDEARRIIMQDKILRKDWSLYLELVHKLQALAKGGGRRLWSYLDGKPPRLAGELSGRKANAQTAELERISWVSYCHDTRMPSADLTIPALSRFVAER